MKVLITGATGQLGSSIIETLLQKKTTQQISAFVRKAESQTALQVKGVQTHVGNYDDLME
jgi:NAD(P)H dehydrogenase (quinone)